MDRYGAGGRSRRNMASSLEKRCLEGGSWRGMENEQVPGEGRGPQREVGLASVELDVVDEGAPRRKQAPGGAKRYAVEAMLVSLLVTLVTLAGMSALGIEASSAMRTVRQRLAPIFGDEGRGAPARAEATSSSAAPALATPLGTASIGALVAPSPATNLAPPAGTRDPAPAGRAAPSPGNATARGATRSSESVQPTSPRDSARGITRASGSRPDAPARR